MKGTVKGHGWSAYVAKGPQPVGGAHNREPQREPLNLGGNAPYFKDGKMNRDPHAMPEGKAVIPSEANRKEVHVFHHRDRDGDEY